MFDSWALTLVVFLPALGAALLIAVPRQAESVMKMVALGTTLITAAVGVGILAGFDYGATDTLQFEVDRPWIDVINSRYHMGVDGISLPLLALSMLITVLCVIYSWDHFP